MTASDREHLAPVTFLFGSDSSLSASRTGPAGQGSSAARTEVDAPAHLASAADDSGLPSAGHDRAVRRAENVSLHGLTRRNMSRWEIERLLVSRDLDEDIIAAEIERLEGVGLIDDAALAETLVRTQRERKGLGHQGIQAELRRRKIAPEIIEAALHESSDDDDEQHRANEVALKRAGQLRSYEPHVAKRRLTAYLQRKGYASEIIREAVAQALDQQPGGRSGVRFD